MSRSCSSEGHRDLCAALLLIDRLFGVEEVGVDQRREQHPDPEREAFWRQIPRCLLRHWKVENRGWRAAALCAAKHVSLAGSSKPFPERALVDPIGQTGVMPGDRKGETATDALAKPIDCVDRTGNRVLWPAAGPSRLVLRLKVRVATADCGEVVLEFWIVFSEIVPETQQRTPTRRRRTWPRARARGAATWRRCSRRGCQSARSGRLVEWA